MRPMQDRASGGAVRVLIASRAAEAVAGLEKLAGYSDLVSLIGFVRHPYELDEDLETLRPDLVLLHPDFATLDTANLVRALRARQPALVVVVVLDQATEPLRARLEEAGATTVPSGAQDEELVAALRSAAGRMAAAGAEPASPGEAGTPPPWEVLGAHAEPDAVPVFDIDAPVPLPAAQPEPSHADPHRASAEDPASLPEHHAAPEAREEALLPPDDLLPPGALPEDLAPPELPEELRPPEDLAPLAEPAEPDEPAAAAPQELEAGPEAAEEDAPTSGAPVDPLRPAEGVPVFHLDTATRDAAPALAPVAAPLAEPEIIQPVRPRPPRRNAGRAHLVVVFSGKGGVGTSMVATNLAVALAAGGARVALVDLDLQFGDVAVMTHTESHPTAIDALAPQGEQVEADFIEEVMATGPEGVRALLAPASPEFADLVNTANLRAILRELAKGYDHVVVDTPAHLEERNLEAIEMADQIVVVSSFNLASIKDTKVTLKLLQSLGIPKERLCVVLNQTRAKSNFPLTEIEESLHFRVLSVLPFDPRVDDCIDNGRPFVTAEPRAELSRQIQVLANPLTGRSTATPEPAAAERPRGGRAARRRFSLGRG